MARRWIQYAEEAVLRLVPVDNSRHRQSRSTGEVDVLNPEKAVATSFACRKLALNSLH